MAKENKPILVVGVNAQDYMKKEYNFGPTKPIRPVDSAFRDRIYSGVEQVENYFSKSFDRWPNVPAVAKVTLYEKAFAKSHRPDKIFGQRTCPVIGTLNLGQLLVSVTPEGLQALKVKIAACLNTHTGIVNLAVIESIEPYFIEDDIGRDESYVLNLFEHNDRNADKNIRETLENIADEQGGSVVQHYISKNTSFFELTNCTSIESLKRFVGVRSIKPMPRYTTGDYSGQGVSVGKLNEKIFPAPEKSRTYPLVGVIDSGTDPEDQFVGPWVWDRFDMLNGKPSNYEHGTMVASLAINSYTLNNGDNRFPTTQTEIIDVVAFPADGNLSLVELMHIIEVAVKKYPEVKVWNLSLGSSDPCEEASFSELGHFLNTLHDTYGCLFIVAAGNYVGLPQRTWPPEKDLLGADRVSMPGDSVRSLTVGSVAHKDHPNTMVKQMQPSSFSRRGPGPAFTPKPDLCHFGGNCDANLDFSQVGVLGAGENGTRVENIGTSFATPIVSSLAACVWQELDINGTVDPTPERIKALMIHGSLLQEGRISTEDTKYKGFGRPVSVEDMIACENSEATFLFEVDTKEGESFGRTPFIIPPSLRTAEGKFVGEIIITLVYSPLLNFQYPSEYCRSNIDVSFGTFDEGSFKGQVPQIKTKSEMYEQALVENGFKWSPVKVYKKQFPKGVKGDQWKLVMEVMRRAEESPLDGPQRAVALITLKSLDPQVDVYSEVKELIEASDWEVEGLVQQAEQKIIIQQ